MNVTTVIHGDSARLTPHGDIDYDSLDRISACVTRIPAAVRHIEWDMRDAPFMDVAGLRLLAAAPGRPERVTTVSHLRSQPLRLLKTADSVFPDMNWSRYLPRPDSAAQ
ncbi:STAS domain-containing protein [Streptomyces sp. NPDC001781]